MKAVVDEPKLGRKPTRAQQRKFDIAVRESQEAVRLLNQRGEREARAAGKPGAPVSIDRGWVVHPDDRGARRRRK